MASGAAGAALATYVGMLDAGCCVLLLVCVSQQAGLDVPMSGCDGGG